jgi:KipI family sensor histidine kinase inhibitor
MCRNPKFLSSGDSCLVIEFSDGIDMDANIRLQNLRRSIIGKNIRGIREFVPTYGSLSIHYDPTKLLRQNLEKIVNASIEDPENNVRRGKHTVSIPVTYGGKYGPDMANVSEYTDLSEKEIIKRHTAKEYYCYMLGFTPGFSYLGGMDESLETPRLKTPRTIIPAGSVGIAGKQTGAYSIDSPGGWQLIGRTPLRLFDPDDGESPTLVAPGDWVVFKSITEDEYNAIKKDVDAGRYIPERYLEDTMPGERGAKRCPSR